LHLSGASKATPQQENEGGTISNLLC